MNFVTHLNYYIVALSVVIAVLASYSALTIAGKVWHTDGKRKVFWLITGAVVLGSGVWSFHFIGMLAFHMDMPVTYDTSQTLLSMLPSMLSALLGFWITMPQRISKLHLYAGGLIMGSGIIAMHYIGMEAMIMPVAFSYNPVWVTISVLIAILASYAAIYLFRRYRNQLTASWRKWISAICLGFAICGMHYAGMKAMNLQEHIGMAMHFEEGHLDPFLLFGVSITVMLLLLISWTAIYFDQHVLEKLAFVDPISELGNRNEMNRCLNTWPSGEKIACLFLDLDQFKMINDTLNHDVGDMLLQEAGKRLQQFETPHQRIFRMGGDEFLILVTGCTQNEAEQLAGNILQSLEETFHIDGNELYITGSIGISMGTIGENGHAALLKEADTAMYEAKSKGKNQYSVYDAALGGTRMRKLLLENDLHKALADNQLYVVYQPQWNVAENKRSGFESLLRWNHPKEGIISPAEFIPIAEETGLILPITRWVLEEACMQCKRWQTQGWTQSIAVNLSIKVFQSNQLFDWVQTALEKADLPPHLLELEITESMVMQDPQDIIRQIESVRKLGVRVSLDDFGTGYSSIGLLDRIPLDCLKLDKLFIQDLETPRKRAIIHGIIFIANSLDLDIVAEGVERQEHIDILSELDCTIMQGYYYGKPMPPKEADSWLGNLKKQPFVVNGI